MAKCDLVLVGAEGVVENGGLVNYIGAYQMAIAAKAHSKPLYALAERYVNHRREAPDAMLTAPTGTQL